jgi:hypothetical protein
MSTFRLCPVAALVALLGAAGCGGSTSTPDDLARSVVGYLGSGDFDGYLASTVVSAPQGLEVCPAAKSFSVDVSKFRDQFTNCTKAFDFSSASVTTTSPSLQTTAAGDKTCGNTDPVNAADKIDVKVTGDGGSYDFIIGSSVETAAGWRQLEHLRCKGPTPECDKQVAATKVCCGMAKTSTGQDACHAILSALQTIAEAESVLGEDCSPMATDCASFP